MQRLGPSEKRVFHGDIRILVFAQTPRLERHSRSIAAQFLGRDLGISDTILSHRTDLTTGLYRHLVCSRVCR